MRRVVHLALFRGINVGGKTKVAMAALRDTSAAVAAKTSSPSSRAAGDWAKANHVELAYVPF